MKDLQGEGGKRAESREEVEPGRECLKVHARGTPRTRAEFYMTISRMFSYHASWRKRAAFYDLKGAIQEHRSEKEAYAH